MVGSDGTLSEGKFSPHESSKILHAPSFRRFPDRTTPKKSDFLVLDPGFSVDSLRFSDVLEHING